MDARAEDEIRTRPLVDRLVGMNAGNDSNTAGADADGRMLQLIGEFLRGGKEKRKALLQKARSEIVEVEEDNGEDLYEPQRITRKIHWQYDSRMKKVPMLRRDYIG